MDLGDTTEAFTLYTGTTLPTDFTAFATSFEAIGVYSFYAKSAESISLGLSSR